MRIQPSDIIANQPALAVRRLMKTRHGTITSIAEQLNVDYPTAKKVFQELLSQGYIEREERPDASNGDDSWYTTIKGNALAGATARRPITRRAAERVVEEFLKHVEEINAYDDYAYRIKQVIIFGSYLGNSPDLGDVDLSILLEDRYSEPHKRMSHWQERIRLALRQGRNFRNVVDQASWPYQEVLLALKKGSPSLALHDEQREQVLSRPIPSKLLFDAASEKRQ